MLHDGYEAAAFFTETGTTRHKGRLAPDAMAFRFVTGEKTVTLPCAGLQFRLGGAADRLLFFSHPEVPGCEVFTTDLTILKDPILLSSPELEVQARSLQQKRMGAKALVVGVLLALVLLAGTLWACRGLMIRTVVEQVPARWEQKLGETAFDSAVADRPRLNAKEVTEPFKRMVAPLLESVDAPGVTFRLYVVEDGTVNAFALPGGIVAVHSGLLLKAESPEEVLGVLAHEIAHVTERHSLQNMVGSVGLFLVVQSFLGDASGLLAVVAENSEHLLSKKFSRDFEREADRIGWAYLQQAGIDPNGLIRFFERLQKEQEEDTLVETATKVFSLWSTHPITRERLAYLHTWSEEMTPMPSRPQLMKDFRALQAALQGHDAETKE